MNATAAAALGRALAESLMTSTCTVRARDGEPTYDPETGGVTPAAGAVRYSGRCRVKPGSAARASADEAGGAVLFSFDYIVSVPFTEADIVEGDLLTIDASPDPALVGAVVEVQRVDRGEHITARRLYCKEVS